MDGKRYSELMAENKGKAFVFSPLGPWEVGLVYSAIHALSGYFEQADAVSPTFNEAAERLKGMCLRAFEEMGFTAEEMESMERRA